MLEELKKLAIEAIKIKKRIQADTEKLQEIKNQVVEKSKDRNSSYTIKVDDGSIRIIKYKRLMYYKLNQRGFDKLDNDTASNTKCSGPVPSVEVESSSVLIEVVAKALP